MRESIGGSMLLYIVLIFVVVVMLLFSSILTYSKAYKIKNRIIEIIEKYENYGKEMAEGEINSDLATSGYNASDPDKCDKVYETLTSSEGKYNEEKLETNINNYGYNYCVFKANDVDKQYYYVVVTFVEFQMPIIGDALTFPVYGETKILGKSYKYVN